MQSSCESPRSSPLGPTLDLLKRIGELEERTKKLEDRMIQLEQKSFSQAVDNFKRGSGRYL